MMFFSGITYNWRGLKMGLRTPALLALGLLRFAVIVAFTVVAAGLALAYHGEMLAALWARPESIWVVWLWYLVSWLLALIMVSVASVVSFLAAQMLFSVIIMDVMSRITERRAAGTERAGASMPPFRYFFYLLRQEIPRVVVPVLIALVILVLGWLTPLAPILTVISSLATGVFLAWDNTDLVPARRLEPFGARFRFLLGNLGFHLGFGLLFLVPVFNILFLSFGPVGATLYYVERIDGRADPLGLATDAVD